MVKKTLGFFTGVGKILFPDPDNNITTGEDEKGIYVMNKRTGQKKYVKFQRIGECVSEYAGEEKRNQENRE